MSSGQDIMQGLATYGRFKSYMTTIVVVLVSLCVFAAGLAWARSSAADAHTGENLPQDALTLACRRAHSMLRFTYALGPILFKLEHRRPPR